MRILFAVHHYLPRYTGGAERYVEARAAQLRARGHDTSVFCIEHIDRGAPGVVTWEDDVYDGVPVHRISFNLAAAPDPFRWSYDNPWIGDHLRAVLTKERPDIFELFGGYLLSGCAIRVPRELGIKTIVRLTDFWYLCPRFTLLRSDGSLSTLPIDPAVCARCLGEEQRRYRIPGRLAPRLMRRFWRHRTQRIAAIRERSRFLHESLRAADAIISPSEFLRTIYVSAGIPPERIVTMRQGQVVPANVADRPRSAAGLRIGYLGQLIPHKGVHVLIEAVRRLRAAPLTLQIFGDVTTQPAYTQRLCDAIGGDPRIALCGTYGPRTALAGVLQGLDVVVVPSLWYENSPMVVLEALAHRTPVIVSDLGSLPEVVIHDRNGLVFAPGDAASLARQLQRLVDHPALLSALRGGIGPVPGLEEEVDALERIYAGLVDEARDAGTSA
jgi:glycosyltransferase involved in cell wall biosynthesis